MKNLILVLLVAFTFSLNAQIIITIPDTAAVTITKKKTKKVVKMVTKYTYGDVMVKVESSFIDSLFDESVNKKMFKLQQEMDRIKQDSIYLAKDLRRNTNKIAKIRNKLKKLNNVKYVKK